MASVFATSSQIVTSRMGDSFQRSFAPAMFTDQLTSAGQRLGILAIRGGEQVAATRRSILISTVWTEPE
jgi:hypothetical protein